MLLAVTLSALAMTMIVGVRYLLVSGAFAAATRLRHPGLYRGLDAQMRREIAWSLASAAIYGIPAGVLAWGWQAHGWTRVYRDVHAYPLWYWPVSILLYLVLHDTWFYWTHRWMHRPAVFKAAHAVHHASRPPTAWAAMAFHPIEALTGAVVIPLLVFVIPIHIGALALVLTIVSTPQWPLRNPSPAELGCSPDSMSAWTMTFFPARETRFASPGSVSRVTSASSTLGDGAAIAMSRV